MTTILIARHGNTFGPGDTVVRVGRRTDIPLVESGKQQARNLGVYLKSLAIPPTAVFTSNLKRTIETANIALDIANIKIPIKSSAIFDEIDYGPDEAKTDQEVIARIGAQALVDWDSAAIVPPGWLIDPQQLIANWRAFAADIADKYNGKTVLVVTSNGIARFAPYLCNDFVDFSKNFKIKLATGAIGALSNTKGSWEVGFWNKVCVDVLGIS